MSGFCADAGSVRAEANVKIARLARSVLMRFSFGAVSVSVLFVVEQSSILLRSKKATRHLEAATA